MDAQHLYNVMTQSYHLLDDRTEKNQIYTVPNSCLSLFLIRLLVNTKVHKADLKLNESIFTNFELKFCRLEF